MKSLRTLRKDLETAQVDPSSDPTYRKVRLTSDATLTWKYNPEPRLFTWKIEDLEDRLNSSWRMTGLETILHLARKVVNDELTDQDC